MTTISTLPTPPSRLNPADFPERTDAFLGALPGFVSQANALAGEANANAATCVTSAGTCTASELVAVQAALDAAATANVTKWASGTAYTEGSCAWSPADRQTYRRNTTGAGITDPSIDTANWTVISSRPRMETEDRSTNTALTTDDSNKLINCSGTWTQAITTTSMREGWFCYLKNAGSGVITVAPSSGTIDEVSSLVMHSGEMRLIIYNGTNFKTAIMNPGAYLSGVSGTWTKPLGYRFFDVILFGAGCGGAGGGSGGSGAYAVAGRGGNGGTGGGGGQSGQKVFVRFHTDTLPSAVPYVCGAGSAGGAGGASAAGRTEADSNGNGGNAGAVAASPGGNSTFGASPADRHYLSASGGVRVDSDNIVISNQGISGRGGKTTTIATAASGSSTGNADVGVLVVPYYDLGSYSLRKRPVSGSAGGTQAIDAALSAGSAGTDGAAGGAIQANLAQAGGLGGAEQSGTGPGNPGETPPKAPFGEGGGGGGGGGGSKGQNAPTSASGAGGSGGEGGDGYIMIVGVI